MPVSQPHEDDFLPEDPRTIMADLTATEAKEYRALIGEQLRRTAEALKLYEPLKFQEEFHACRAKQCIIQKGNQVGGEQPLDSVVMTPQGKTTMGALDVGDVILGGDGLPCVVEGTLEFGYSPVYRFTFSDGTTCEAGENHKWTLKMGGRTTRPENASVDAPEWTVHTTKEILAFIDKWGYRFGSGRGSGHYRICFPTATAQFAPRQVPIDPYTLGVLLGDGNFTHDSINVTSEDEELVGAMTVPTGCKISKLSNKSTTVERYGKASLYGISGTEWHNNPLANGLESLGLRGKRGCDKFIPECYIHNSVDARLSLLQGLMDTDGHCGAKHGAAMLYTTSERLAEDITDLVQSLGGTASVEWRANSHNGKEGKRLAHICVTLPKGMNPFRLSRKRDRRRALKHKYRGFRYLQKVEYIGNKYCRCIKVSNASETYLTDNYIVTHNTLCGAVELARALTNQDPHGKYPTVGNAAVIGYGENHIGRVVYPALFQPGQFKVIRDKKTGKKRVWKPWLPEDAEREGEAEDAPPLIPFRYVKPKGIAWVKKADRIFSRIEFTTGWVLYALNSAGDPSQAQGFKLNYCWIDEDLANSGWHREMMARLSMRKGRLRWTALPHAKNDDILNMIQEADKLAHLPADDLNKQTICVRATIFDNPFFPKESLESNIRAWKQEGEDVYRQRALGELTFDSVRMYPTFSKWTHNALGTDEKRTPIQQVLFERAGEPPEHWTRYMATDPGWQVAGTLFAATPPPGEFDEDYLVVYDELYLHNCLPDTFADGVYQKARDYVFETFIIDAHGAKLSGLSSGQQALHDYTNALKKKNIKSLQSGSSFIAGSDDIRGRETRLREMLALRENGMPKLLVVMPRCPNLLYEMERFKKKMTMKNGNRITFDEGDRKNGTHVVECLEYLAAHGCPYRKPPDRAKHISAYDQFMERQRRQNVRQQAYASLNGRNFISFGPQGVPSSVGSHG